MKALCIDPGCKQSAYVILDHKGKIYDKGILPNLEMLQFIKNGYTSDRMVIEMVAGMGMAVGKEVFETVFWIGRFVQAQSPGKWTRLYRQEIKLHLCGQARAKDANVRQVLLDKYGKPGTIKKQGPTYGLKADMWSALAVGTTWFETKWEDG